MTLAQLKFGLLTIGLIFSIQGKANPDLQATYLGQTKVQNVFSDSDVVEFGACNGVNNKFIQYIQLRVDRMPVEIEDLVIQYGNGEQDRLVVRNRFEPGTSSRLIQVNGNRRCVSRAYIRARTVGLFREGIVSFYGFYYQDTFPPGPGPGSFLLGRTNLDFNRDADQIFVSSCSGNDRLGARQVRLHVIGNDANIEAFVITFGNGEVANIPVRERFARNSWSVWKDLPGDQRCIREIFVMGRTLNNGYNTGRAIVDVFGTNLL